MARPAKIHLAHARIALHVVHDVFDEDASLVKDRNERIQPADEFHIVFDDDNARGAVDNADKLDRSLDLFRSHPRRGLVEQHELWALGHDHADVDPLAHAVRKCPNGLLGDVSQIEAIDHLVDGDSGTGHRMPKARRKPQILRDTKTLEHAGDLVLDPDSETPDCVRRPASDLLPIEDDASAAGAKLTGDELEEGALARAVRADQ